MNPEVLQRTIRSTIPMSEYMNFAITHLDELSMSTRAPLGPNINIHGTAFAGALYTLGALTAWGMVQSRLPSNAVLVMSEGNIRYRHPVNGDLLARCQLDAEATDVFLQKLTDQGRSRMEVEVRIGDPMKPAAQFTGHMHASLKG